MCNRNRTVIAVLFTAVALLSAASACGTSEPATPQQEQPQPTDTRLPVERPTIAPTASAAESATLSQEQLHEKWSVPVAAGSFVVATCEGLIDTADKLQANEIDGFEATGQLIGSGIVLVVVEESLAAWTPSPELSDSKQALGQHVDAIQDVVGQWLDAKLTSADVRGILGDECSSAHDTLDGILQAAQSDGITAADIDALAADLGAALDEAVSELELEAPPEETLTPQETGFSRGNPFPPSVVASVPNWDVQVLEVVRGDEAWQAIQAANPFNEPAPGGMEYLLVKVRAKSTYADDEEHSISGWDFKVTGDRFIQYSTASVVMPDPSLDAELFAGGETEGWAAYLVGQGEGSLILVVDELMNWDDDRFRYLALEEDASVHVPSELSSIEPTSLGEGRSSPAPFGSTVTTEDWEVAVLDAVRGDDAWTMVQDANQYNDPPEEGMEYIAIKMRVRYITTADQAAHIDGFLFKTTGSANVLYDLPSVVEPSPALDASLFPGGEYEGWVVAQAAIGEAGVMAVFDPPFDFSGKNKRFLSLGL